MLELFALIAIIIIVFISSNTIEKTTKGIYKQNEEIIQILKEIRDKNN